MANQNRAREKAAADRANSKPPKEPTVYELIVPKTQAQYDYERKKKREQAFDDKLRRAEETLRNFDLNASARKRAQDEAECDRWGSSVDAIGIGSDAVKSVMNTFGYPDAISKYRGIRGEVENWRYSNSKCYVSIDVLKYRVVSVFASRY